MSRFNTKAPSTKTENLAGGVAFKHDTKTELVHAVLTTFLENKFYESGDARAKRIVQLVSGVSADFVARLAVIARTEFNLRSVSHLLLGELSKVAHGTDLVKRAVEKAVVRPDDMTEVTSYLEGKLSKQLKRGFRRAILKFSPYQLAKYRMEGKKVKLVDIFNLVHPKVQFASEEQKKAWEMLMKGELKSEETWESRLSSGEDKAKVWKDLVMEEKIGYMALLRNLRNIEQQADEMTQEKAAQMICDEALVRKSRQLPFRFFNAYENVSTRQMHNAIAKALDISVSNVPELSGQTLIGIDTSGSMSGECIKKASMLAAALIKKANCDVVLYDTSVKQVTFNSLDSVMSNAEKIQRLAMGGGTETSLVFKAAAKIGTKYSRIIILSDNESWNDGYRGVQGHYNEYAKLNPDCFVYAIDIQGYGTKDVTGDKVEHLCGFSERIFDFMLTKERGIENLTNYIENYNL